MANKTYWNTLEYNGPAIPDPYVPKGLCIHVSGKTFRLSPAAEEMAYQFAKKKDTGHFRDPVFIANFMIDFRKRLPEEFKDINFKHVDFSEFYEFVDREKKIKESLTKEERKLAARERKERKEQQKKLHGYAIIDGNVVEVGNWMIEPPGIFIGRGSHPLRGRWKERVEQSDIELNLGENAPVPPGNWKGIMHDHGSMWLARWEDKLTGKMKYVWPHDSSYLLQERTKEKYDRAMRLERYLDKLRSRIIDGMSSPDEKIRKVATVCFLIDKLGMRVGDEKDEDEADTVGATTLRVEHVRLHQNRIEFDFLGKDSVRWQKSIEKPPVQLVQNLSEFMEGKNLKAQIFDGINSRMVNNFLSSVDGKITAKAFRTFHATKIVQRYLLDLSDDIKEKDDYVKLYYAKLANLQAAIFCNHKRTPPKNWEESLKKKKEKINELLQSNPKTEKQKDTLEKRLLKLRLTLDLAKRTKDYNLNTSLRNYIDPRIFKSWCDSVGLEWKKLYTSSLQRKFAWANRSRISWPPSVKVLVHPIHR